jgi:hypothetical protein
MQITRWPSASSGGVRCKRCTARFDRAIMVQFLGPLAACRVLQASRASTGACTALSLPAHTQTADTMRAKVGQGLPGLPAGSRRECCVSCRVQCPAWELALGLERRIMFIK